MRATLPALVALASCSHDHATPFGANANVFPDSAVLNVPTTLRVLSLSTYDGSGQTVHPDYVSLARPWVAPQHYLAITPYPNGSNKKENPSLFTGTDGVNWRNAAGAPNPLVFPSSGYLSDPDMVYSPGRNELFLYYRQTDDLDVISLIRSSDGAQWGPPVKVLSGPFNTIISPTVVRRSSGDWLMWTIHPDSSCRGPSTAVELRRSTDGITWSQPEDVDMGTPFGYYAWHIDVQWIKSRNEFWALFPVKTAGNCATRQLYLATSPDGITWTTLPAPLASAGVIKEFGDIVYRSTFFYDAGSDNITFWISGAHMTTTDNFVWSTAVQRRAREEVFHTLMTSAVRELRPARRGVNAKFDPP
ncbi:MAG: hypothetical protein ACHQQ3_04735 [Gemmatimonadales bacterium]